MLSVCIQDFAHETGASPRAASFFPGKQMFGPQCARPYIRSMVNPADDGKSWSCWCARARRRRLGGGGGGAGGCGWKGSRVKVGVGGEQEGRPSPAISGQKPR